MYENHKNKYKHVRFAVLWSSSHIKNKNVFYFLLGFYLFYIFMFVFIFGLFVYFYNDNNEIVYFTSVREARLITVSDACP